MFKDKIPVFDFEFMGIGDFICCRIKGEDQEKQQ